MKSDKPGPAAEDRYIPGVYNYCDRWCERCRFRRRCRVYRDIQRMEEALERGDRIAAINNDDEEENGSHAAPPPEWLALIEAANRVPSEAEIERETAKFERRRDLKDSHPLSISSREYAEATHRMLAALRPMAEERGDPVVLAALDTIDRFASLIAVKTWRAVGGLILDIDDEEDDEEDENDEPIQNDANGCAKLVRLIAAESRDAWEVLMQVGHATADGIPALMVQRLERLDAEIARQFPRAMEFVRAGFDEVPMS